MLLPVRPRWWWVNDHAADCNLGEDR